MNRGNGYAQTQRISKYQHLTNSPPSSLVPIAGGASLLSRCSIVGHHTLQPHDFVFRCGFWLGMHSTAPGRCYPWRSSLDEVEAGLLSTAFFALNFLTAKLHRVPPLCYAASPFFRGSVRRGRGSAESRLSFLGSFHAACPASATSIHR